MSAATDAFDSKRYTANNLSQVLVKSSSATTVYKGTLVMIDSGGKALPAAPAAGSVFGGVAVETVVNAASGTEKVNLENGVFGGFNNSGTSPLVAADLGQQAYVEDDNTVKRIAGAHGMAAGRFLGFDENNKVIIDTNDRDSNRIDPPVSLTAAVTLTEKDHGKTFILNLAGGFTVTLPANSVAGFRARFIVGIAPTTAYIIAAATADTMAGHVLSSSGAAEDSENAATGDQLNFVAATAVIGDQADIFIDGTSVFVSARVAAAGGATITG